MRKQFCKGKRALKVYSLSGPSGTGKSTSALAFAHKLGVEAIVDDGLLIVNGVRVAGLSAKFEKNTITAVRRAIFTDPVHREAVQKALAHHQVQSILLIGTSTKMTNSIAKQLELGPIEHYYNVEDVRSLKEIQKHALSVKHRVSMLCRFHIDKWSKISLNDWCKGHGDFSSKREKSGKRRLYVLIFSGNI